MRGYTSAQRGPDFSGMNAGKIWAIGVPSGVPSTEKRVLEGKRMVSGHTGNVVLRKELRVRISCPPLR